MGKNPKQGLTRATILTKALSIHTEMQGTIYIIDCKSGDLKHEVCSRAWYLAYGNRKREKEEDLDKDKSSIARQNLEEKIKYHYKLKVAKQDLTKGYEVV